ncbi:MAG: LicD family protein [Lachnospiraceae bacterium]|nr:LicD family protein [Lachnospiraceae bacterium]
MKLDFFRDEVRCGFYIPTAIKQAWAGSLAVLAEVDRVCQKEGISYFAEWGTLLGAVRHGGFVPWDDDLDIGMRRQDYIRFRQAVDNGALSDGFDLQDFRNQENHWLFITRVVNTERMNFDPAHLNRFYNFPYIASIDIFLYDDLYADPEKERQRCDEVKEILATADGIVAGRFHPSTVIGQLEVMRQRYGVDFDPAAEPHALGVALYDLAERQMARTKPEESDRVGQIFPWILKGGKGLPKEYYEKTMRLSFEDTTIPVAAAYDQILRSRYGDYFQIHKVWGGHGYPFFEGQKRALEEVAGGKLPEYEFDQNALSYVWDNTADRQLTTDQVYYDKCMTEMKGVTGEILFLASGPMNWQGLDSLYWHYANTPGCHVTVVALPMCFKDALGRVTVSDEQADALARVSEYPDYVKITEWWDLDINHLRFDLVLIQDPYDAKNPVLTIPDWYYCERIRRFAERIVYIPPFFGDDFTPEASNDVYNLKHYVLTPGVSWADLVLLPSETLRKRWLEKLTEWAGEYTAEYWEHKLICTDCMTGIENHCDEDSEKEKQSGHTKKLLWCIGANVLTEEPDRILQALHERIRIFDEAKDTVEASVFFYPADRKKWREIDHQLTDSVMSLFENITIVDESVENINNPVDEYDAYYGSPSPLIVAFSRQKKPVMLADYSVSG